MKLVCIKPIEGLTVGKEYELLGCAGEYVQVTDDNEYNAILFESYFDIVEDIKL